MRWLTTSPFKQMLVAWVSLHCCMKASTAPDILRHVSSRPVVKAACRHGSVTSTSAKQPLWRSYKLRTNFGQRGLRINLFTQRWGGLQVRAVRESSMQKSEAKEGSSWVSSGVLLALGGALPGLVLASKWQQISNMGPAYQSTALAAVDTTFIITATVFLSLGSLFGTQRYGDTPSYPGPFVEQDGTRSPPSFFQAYVVLVPLLLGIIAPTAGLGLLMWQDDAYLGASTLGVYLVEVAAQLISEEVYLKTKTAMWPQVPQVYQTYRIWQLIRGCYLVGQAGGPQWLWNLHAMLIMLWVFNFGAVMTWTPWLYRWHLQPQSSENDRKDGYISGPKPE